MKDMQVYMLSLFFLSFDEWTNRNRTSYIFQILNFVIFFIGNFLPALPDANFLREIEKVIKYLKAVEIKIFNLSF